MINICPKPKKIHFENKWFEFDGFLNLPDFLSDEFKVPKGSWILEKTEGNRTGLEIEDKKVRYWRDENVVFSTIIQLFLQGKRFLPKLTIEEEFQYDFRCFHLDIARGGVPSIDTFKKILRYMFLAKMNYFAIYFEDLFPWENHPKIGQKRGRLTKDELNEIISYAKNLGIEVLPSLELTGHMENILSLPEYTKYSEWHFSKEGCLDLSNQDARNFAYELLEEVLSFFKSKYVHIGADETWALGRGKSLEKSWKFEGPRLYEEHHKNMIDLAEKYNKIPLVWGDMLTGMYLNENEKRIWRSLLDSSIWQRSIIANWDYEDRNKEQFLYEIESFGDRYQSNQFICPGFSNWNRFYPDFEKALVNIKNFLAAGKDKGLKGFIVTSWGDNGQECLFYYIFPLIVASSALAEGDENWEKYFCIFSGEDEETVDIRKLLGESMISNNLKALLYGGYEYKDMDEKSKKALYEKFDEVIEKMRYVDLPDDLSFLERASVVCKKRLQNKLKVLDLIDLCDEYKNLWLSERKREGLERIVGRFWKAAGLIDME